jgi:hypothetical protein
MGRKFKIKEVNGADFDRMAEKYVTLNAEGILNVDLSLRNAQLLSLVVDAPYDKEGKKFAELEEKDRIVILQNLKPVLRDKLLRAINTSMIPEEDIKKK